MPFDSLQLLRSAATTASFTGTGIQIDGTALSGVVIRIVVPQATGTSPTATFVVQDSADDSTYNTIFSFRQITAAGVLYGRFHTQRKYIRLIGTIGGTSPNFGTVKAGPDAGGYYKNEQRYA